MRKSIAKICLVVAIVWFILGTGVIGHAPEWFLISAAFAFVAMLLGKRLVRISGALLVVVSIAVAIGEYRAKLRSAARIREIKQKAAGRMQP